MTVLKLAMFTRLLLFLLFAASGKDCSDDIDCSFNGVCTKGACVCDDGWNGQYCHALNLMPAVNGSGLNQLHQAPHISTWGGSALRHDDGKYHMWASEISRHCGIHRWVTNSIVVHAVSDGPPDWRFERKEEVFPLFSHEPIVARAPTGEYVMYITHFNGDASDCPICNCTDGNSYTGESGCAGECGGSPNKTLYSYFSFASSPDGPWSPLVSLAAAQPNPHTDMNLAPVILPDGSALAWTRWDIWQAKNWRDASSWKDMGQAPDWDHGGVWEGEDPSVWVDKRGHFHSISHNGERGKEGFTGDCGRHMFSETGGAGTWRIAGPKKDLGFCAYPRTIPFADGSTRTFYRRERPHVILGENGSPVALSTAVIDSPSREAQDPQRDASYTLVQAVSRTPVPGPPPPPVPTPTPPPPPATTCAGFCKDSGMFCEGTTSACQVPSCQQGCLIRKATASVDKCIEACHNGMDTCSFSVGPKDFDNCGMCKGPNCGGETKLGCEQGCRWTGAAVEVVV